MPQIRTFADQALSWVRDIARINRSALPRHLKRQILRTYLALAFNGDPRRRNAKPLGRVLQYDVNASSVAHLRLLFREIFIDLDYYFETGTSAPLIVDCGANIGMATFFFNALYPRASIIAVEAAPDTFELLRENIVQNSLMNVTLHHAAVGDGEGLVDFFTAPVAGSFTSSTLMHRSGGVKTSVPRMRVSSLIAGRAVDFLKVDVEGAEWDVFRDLVSRNALPSVRQMVVEYHHHLPPERDQLGTFLQQIEDFGFTYQLRARYDSPPRRSEFQDVLIHAWQRNG